MRYSFAGHETFTCKHYWLKKGYDHSVADKKFNDEAVIDLGVGKNMVNSISFWMKAFGLYEEDVVLRDLLFIVKKDTIHILRTWVRYGFFITCLLLLIRLQFTILYSITSGN